MSGKVILEDFITGDTYILENVYYEITTLLNNTQSIKLQCDYSKHNEDVFNKINKRWKLYINEFSNDNYFIIDEVEEKTKGKYSDLILYAISKFNDDMKQDMLYENHTGSKTALGWIAFMEKYSRYKFSLDVKGLQAKTMDNFGMCSVGEALDRFSKTYNVEYYLNTLTNTVHIVSIVGNIKSDYVKYEVNLIDTARKRDFSDFATYGKGFGAFKDPDDESKGRYETDYTHELAKTYGKLPINPVSDERFTVIYNLKDEIKTRIENSIINSIEVTIDDIQMGFETDLICGDTILLVDPRLNINSDVRVFEIVKYYNDLGDLVDIKYTLNQYSQSYSNAVKDDNTSHSINQLIPNLQNQLGKVEYGVTQQLNSLSKVYRQETEPRPVDKVPVNSIWYKPIKNPVRVIPDYDIEMYGMVEDANGVKSWSLLSDKVSRDASRLNIGTLDASVVNVINLNANSIVTGTLRAIDIIGSTMTGSTIVSESTRYKAKFQAANLRYFNKLNDEQMGMLTVYTESSRPEGVSLSQTEGYSLTLSTSSKGNVNKLRTVFEIPKDSNFSKPRYVLRGNGDFFGNIYSTDNIKSSSMDTTDLKVISTGEFSSVKALYLRNKTNSSMQIDIAGNNSLFVSTNGYSRMKVNAEGLMVYGNTTTTTLNVAGSKNLIHVTRDGVRATPAYESPEDWLFDLGKGITDNNNFVKIEIDDLTYDIMNTDIDYLVELTADDFGQVIVREKHPRYFLVESSVPNLSFVWRINVKRRGYETGRYREVEQSFKEIEEWAKPKKVGDD